jgi:hypothetical protein
MVRYKEAGNDEEHINADVSAAESGHSAVIGQHNKYGDCS